MARSLEIDDTIHQKTRLAIMSHLAVVEETDFNDLKRMLKLTDGNLSVHTTILENKGFLESEKGFVGKKTRTTYKITPAGRKAFGDYVAQLESILKGQIGE